MSQSIPMNASVVYAIELSRLGRDECVQVGTVKSEVSAHGQVLVKWPWAA